VLVGDRPALQGGVGALVLELALDGLALVAAASLFGGLTRVE
jgi:hypothetical protein